MLCLVLPGGRPGPRFFSLESGLEVGTLLVVGTMAVGAGGRGTGAAGLANSDEVEVVIGVLLESDFFRFRPATKEKKMVFKTC